MGTAIATDRDLVRDVLNGKRHAFTTLTERYISSAHAVARARLGRAAEVDDAVQEAFLRAFERLGTLRDPAKFGPWLLTIARHEAIRLATQRIKSNPLDDSTATDDATTPDIEQREMNALLRDHVMKLSEPAREVLLLHYFAGKSTREIAVLLEVRRAAVLKRLQRARELLAESLLTDLESTRPSRDSLAKQAARIAALTTTAAIPVASATAVHATGVSWAGGFAAVSGVAIAIAVGAVLYLAANPQGSSSEASAQPSASNASMILMTEQQASDQSDSARRRVSFAATTAQRIGTAARDPNLEIAQAAPSGEPQTSPDLNLDESLEQIVTLEFENEHVARVLEKITEVTGVEFLIDARAVGLPVYGEQDYLPRVPFVSNGMLAEVNIRDMPLTEALQRIAQELGLQAVLEPGYVWISTPANIAREMRTQPRERFDAYDVGRILETPVSMVFRDQHLGEVLEFISGTYELNLAYDPRVVAPYSSPGMCPRYLNGKVTDGTIPLVIFKDIVLRDLLAVLCRMLNVEAVFERDCVWLSSRDQILRDGLRDAPMNERQELERVLDSKTSVMFEDISFAEIAGFLFDLFKVRMVLDQRVTYWPEEPVSARPLRGDAAHAKLHHGMLKHAGGSNVSLRAFLELNLRHLGLAHHVHEGRVVVTFLQPGHPDAVIDSFLVEPSAYPAVVVPELADDDAPEPPPAPAAEGPQLQLLSIQQGTEGNYRAQIQSAGTVKFYSVGDAFLKYEVLTIDAATGCVTLLDEREQRSLTLCGA